MLKQLFSILTFAALTLGDHAAPSSYTPTPPRPSPWRRAGVGLATADYNAVVPLPQSITTGKGKPFTLSSATPVYIAPADRNVLAAEVGFLKEYVAELTGIKLQTAERLAKQASAIVLALDPKIRGREAYRLTVSERRITIAGSTSAGVFYGIQTLRKALPVTDREGTITLPSTMIADAPRFSYRGMMLDCCRHFFPLAFVKKYIDMIALHNMNVFHWHLSDDQGWRIEIKKYPRLTEIGAFRSGTVIGHNSAVDDGARYGGFYTQEEAREIVEYARLRHVTVIPEIDMPGHTLAVLAAYPALGCTGGPYEVCHKWGIFPDVLCLGNEQIYPVVQDVIDELCDIFPSEYFHIGGDECPTERWAQCPRCLALARSKGIDIHRLQQYFTNRMEKYVNSKGRKIIGWDEILNGEINKSATIMSWRGVEPGSKAAALGHDVIMTPNVYAYFDYYQTKNVSQEPNAIGGYVPVEKVYELDPAPGSFTAAAKQHILGAQANLWAEYIACPNHVEYMVMPRMAAMAEVQWMSPERKHYNEFLARLNHLARIYDRLGYVYAKHVWEKGK